MDIDIERIVQQQIDEIDFTALAESTVEKIIRKEMMETIKKEVDQQAKELVLAGINEILNSPVMTDDGWGKRVEYANFEALFKKCLKEKMDGHWEAKRVLEKAIKDRTDALVNTEWKRVIQKIVDELTNSKVIKR